MSEALDRLTTAINGRRQLELPRLLRTVSGVDALTAELSAALEIVASTRPLLVSGASQSAAVSHDLQPSGAIRTTVTDNTRAEVERVAVQAAEADAVVAVGGGRPIDVAKSAALLADLPVIVIPTQLSADGIASPISVIANAPGEVVSERAALPMAVLADLQTICAAPVGFARAGMGDLLSNRTALVDWQLAAAAGKDELDDFAALLSSTAHLLVEGLDLAPLKAGTLNQDLAQRLLDGLVLSGLAMELAGSSRPCSGSEHLISHALDALEPGTAPHGEQVAFGTLVATALQGGDVARVKDEIAAIGMNSALQGFDLGAPRLAQIVAFGPSTRPGRFTVLDTGRPTGAELESLIASLIA